jgi:coenzyme F420-reducing hydrogenase alpha subunit
VPRTDTARTFHVAELTRVEGEGSLDVVLERGEITQLRFGIFEAPRFYEAFLRGRDHREVTDITARICGICPVAYQTSSANAMEQILGLSVPDAILDLRRLLYLGEWLESHALHVYLLHAPDFLGYRSGIELARDHQEVVARGLRLKKIGNAIMTLVGGREIHPINPRVGGFWKAPAEAAVRALGDDLDWALDAALETVRWVAQLPIPALEVDYEFVALHDPDEYAVIDGRIRSTGGIDIAVDEWGEVFEESHVEWSNALHAKIKGRGTYHVGPLARYAIGFEQLHPLARKAAEEAGLGPVEHNPFKSIVVRAVELVHAAATSLDIVGRYRPPRPSHVEAPVRAGIGHGASEAPRGLLYHRYEIDGEGLITDARIVPPTAQNQPQIEADLRGLIPTILELSDEEIQWRLEQAIRNYDPCISCATHFLRVNLERRS